MITHKRKNNDKPGGKGGKKKKKLPNQCKNYTFNPRNYKMSFEKKKDYNHEERKTDPRQLAFVQHKLFH